VINIRTSSEISMIKYILFDIDGVLIPSNTTLFSEKYSDEHNIAVEVIVDFINNQGRLCKLGKADLLEELKIVKHKWNWAKSAEELLAYWINTEYLQNKKLIDIIQTLRKSGIKCYLASDNEKYRAAQLLQALEVNTNFDGYFFSYNLGHTKAEEEYFEVILLKLGINDPSEVMICDDSKRNLTVASTVGLKTFLYEGFEFGYWERLIGNNL